MYRARGWGVRRVPEVKVAAATAAVEKAAGMAEVQAEAMVAEEMAAVEMVAAKVVERVAAATAMRNHECARRRCTRCRAPGSPGSVTVRSLRL